MNIRPGLTFNVVNLGCKVNRVESDTIAARLLALGCVPAPLEDAGLVVVNTCTVTGEADRKARKAVRHALKAAPSARVVVTGCSIAIDPESYARLDERVSVMQRAELLAHPAFSPGSEGLRMGEGFHTRVNIKVQDGCDRACTYCIVHVARGRARSMAFDDVMGEARSYLERGVREIVLTGIDLGSYRHGGAGLAQLVESLLELCDRHAGAGEVPARIRASSLEPVTVDDDFIELLARSDGRLCRHLHLPVQSGSSKVLKEMARPYTAERYASLVEGLRSRISSLSLTTDVIVGFPGETPDDFAATCELARRCGFSKIHVFPYSMRAGTPAARRTDQVDPAVKSRRARELRQLSDELRLLDRQSRSGTTELALVETDVAVTESYHEFPLDAQGLSGLEPGALVPMAFD